MKFLIVDDEQLAIDYLTRQLRQIDPSCEVRGYTDPVAALGAAKNEAADIAFLDVEMYGMTGIELAKACKDVCPGMAIVFVTGFSHYAMDAFAVHARGYLLKPPEQEAIRTEIALIMQGTAEKPKGKRIRVQAFGSFEIFVDGTPVKFGRSKSKELLAYLVDRRGAAATVQEIIGVLFEERDSDETTASLVRTLVSDMIRSLKAVGADEIVVKSRNSLSVRTSAFDCDYYAFLAGDTDAINRYAGEYMANYTWAEFTTGVLDEKAGLY